jgi:hypothetical protein
MLNSLICKRLLFLVPVLCLAAGLSAVGPVDFNGDPAVTIYRDYDDGLFGRSIYRGVMFSVKLDSFSRYRTLPVGDTDGLTSYLVSSLRGADFAGGSVEGLAIRGTADRENLPDPGRLPEKWLYEYNRHGINIIFSLESAPEDLFDEINRVYAPGSSLNDEVSEFYRRGYIVRIHAAENLYRPQFAGIDYEDVLISASFIGDRFQPLWGIHDGNGLEMTLK